MSVDAHFWIHTMRKKAQWKARPKGPPRRPKSKKGPKKEVQGKAIIAKRKSAVEYSSLAEWLQQMKINWVQDPFDPVNIIWPTKAQILLYKR